MPGERTPEELGAAAYRAAAEAGAIPREALQAAIAAALAPVRSELEEERQRAAELRSKLALALADVQKEEGRVAFLTRMADQAGADHRRLEAKLKWLAGFLEAKRVDFASAVLLLESPAPAPLTSPRLTDPASGIASLSGPAPALRLVDPDGEPADTQPETEGP